MSEGRAGAGRRLPLIALAAAAILPILVFAAGMIVLFDRQQQAVVERSLRQVARSALEAAEQKTADDFATLAALAASPTINNAEFGMFERHLARVAADQDDWLSAGLVDPESLRAEVAVGVPVAAGAAARLETAPIRIAAETQRPQVGNFRAGAGGRGDGYVTLAQPVVRGGRVTHVLAAAIDAEAYSRVLQRQGFEPDWTVAILDRDRVILARNRAPEAFVGTVATRSLTDEIDRAQENFFFALNKEGDRVYTAFVTSGRSGWTAAVGAPAAAIERPLRRSLLVLLAAGAAALALGLGLAALFIRSLDQRHRAERRLVELEAQQAVERRLTDIAANLPGAIFRRVVHPDGTISHPYFSDGLEQLTGVPADRTKRKMSLDEFAELYVAAADRERWRKTVTIALEALEPYRVEVRLPTDDGPARWVHSTARPHRTADGAIVWDGVVLDITGLKQAEERLAASLAEKETLLREIHHRVRNNLQVISSLLQLEIRQFTEPEARERVGRISQRIAVLGRIHDQLYASENFARIDFAHHLEQLCASLRELHAQGQAVTIELDAERLYCDLETAIPLGLIANELVTNGLKHGAAGDQPARVRVGLAKSADGATASLTVANDGAAPPPAAARPGGGLGMRIVQALASQINADLAVDGTDGWRATVTLSGDRMSE